MTSKESKTSGEKIEEVLSDLYWRGNEDGFKKNVTLSIEAIDSALTAIQRIRIEDLPKEKPTCEAYQGDRKHLLTMECVQLEIDRNINYNKAIQTMKERIGE